MAIRQARELRRLNDPSVADGVTIHLLPGTYNLYEPLRLRAEDSGTPSQPTVIRSEGGEAIVSGGVTIGGWKRQGKLLVAEVPDFNGYPLDFRQLYVGGEKAIRARDVADFDNMARIRSIDKQRHILYVPATKAMRQLAREGVGHAEMTLHEMWCISNLRIKSVAIQGDSAAVTFHEPESTIQFEHPWPSPMVNMKPVTMPDGREHDRNSPFFLTNHLCLLDSPGEWYHDIRTHRLYYMPRSQAESQQLLSGKTTAIVPALETLMTIDGTPDYRPHDIRIEGVTFAYSTWMRPSLSGHVPLQAGMYLLEAYRLNPKQERTDNNHKLDNQGWVGRPGAAVSINHADDVCFSKCTFTHLASTGLDYCEGTHGGSVSHNTFTDIGGSAVLAGSFSPEAFEQHLPYNPADRRVVCRGLEIADNDIHNVAAEDWGCVGIGCGWVAETRILRNEIHEVSYTGISLGWGWNQTVNCMHNNEVKDNNIYNYASHMYDVAGIYTLGAQPKTVISGNSVKDIYHPSYVHDPNHWFYLYCDEGSSFITVRDNYTPAEKYLRNANGPCNVWENNGPGVKK